MSSKVAFALTLVVPHVHCAFLITALSRLDLQQSRPAGHIGELRSCWLRRTDGARRWTFPCASSHPAPLSRAAHPSTYSESLSRAVMHYISSLSPSRRTRSRMALALPSIHPVANLSSLHWGLGRGPMGCFRRRVHGVLPPPTNGRWASRGPVPKLPLAVRTSPDVPPRSLRKRTSRAECEVTCPQEDLTPTTARGRSP